MNILAALGVSLALEIPTEAIVAGVKKLETAPGRLERVPSRSGTVFVDYAHTPDALKTVLEALGKVKKGKIITIMGCGGDRDKSKRSVMGAEAAAGSDFVVVTSDNPRSEDPIAIIDRIIEGVTGKGYESVDILTNSKPLKSGGFCVIPDRREAIEWAVKRLNRDDILLVAGKGHEDYQEIHGERLPFDDRKVVGEALRELDDADETPIGNNLDDFAAEIFSGTDRKSP
jgi:UDP-N-acetylmuramyl-tripeptide synthetase